MFTSIRKHLANVLAVISAVGVVSFSAAAFAAGPTQVVGGLSQVEYPGTYLMIQYSGVNYIGQGASPGCSLPAYSADTIKMWASLSQASLLSGKNMTIYYNDCNGAHYISDLVLIK